MTSDEGRRTRARNPSEAGAQAQRRKDRRRVQIWIAGAVTTVLLAIGVTVWGQRLRVEAEEQRQQALSRQLAAMATKEIGRDHELATGSPCSPFPLARRRNRARLSSTPRLTRGRTRRSPAQISSEATRLRLPSAATGHTWQPWPRPLRRRRSRSGTSARRLPRVCGCARSRSSVRNCWSCRVTPSRCRRRRKCDRLARRCRWQLRPAPESSRRHRDDDFRS